MGREKSTQRSARRTGQPRLAGKDERLQPEADCRDRVFRVQARIRRLRESAHPADQSKRSGPRRRSSSETWRRAWRDGRRIAKAREGADPAPLHAATSADAEQDAAAAGYAAWPAKQPRPVEYTTAPRNCRTALPVGNAYILRPRRQAQRGGEVSRFGLGHPGGLITRRSVVQICSPLSNQPRQRPVKAERVGASGALGRAR